jgi:hypothetical protein
MTFWDLLENIVILSAAILAFFTIVGIVERLIWIRFIRKIANLPMASKNENSRRRTTDKGI